MDGPNPPNMGAFIEKWMPRIKAAEDSNAPGAPSKLLAKVMEADANKEAIGLSTDELCMFACGLIAAVTTVNEMAKHRDTYMNEFTAEIKRLKALGEELREEIQRKGTVH